MNTLRLSMRLRLYAILVAATCLVPLDAFRTCPAARFAISGRGGGGYMKTRQQGSSLENDKILLELLTTTSTRLLASLQFKNVEQMLNDFGDEPVLIAFTAINCGPCKLQRKELLSVKKDLGEMALVAIDTDRWPKVGSRFQVGKLPCLVAFKNGEVLLRMEGLRTADEIVSSVRSLLL